MAETKKPAHCLTKRCRRPSKARGLCPTCLRAAYRMIERGEATDAGLVAAGLMRENTRPAAGLFRKQATK